MDFKTNMMFFIIVMLILLLASFLSQDIVTQYLIYLFSV